MILYIKENFTDHLRHFLCKEKRQKGSTGKRRKAILGREKGMVAVGCGDFPGQMGSG